MIDIEKAAEHVEDANAFHIPGFLWQMLPDALKGEHPHPGSIPLPVIDLFGYELQITKFMALEVVAALLMIGVFVPLAMMVSSGKRPQGIFWNLFEAMLLFLRDEVARPAIGKDHADRYLPYLWNAFFFVLFCNLLGMVPWAGSPTGSLAVTATLALGTFLVVISSGMLTFGLVGFWTGMVPHMELPWVLAIFLWPMLLVIEVLGLLIKHLVLGVRLLANVFAGHLVLAVILGFIAAAAPTVSTFLGETLWTGVTFFSVVGSVALSCLELFVAFLQAYIFTFLSALFIGMAVHQH